MRGGRNAYHEAAERLQSLWCAPEYRRDEPSLADCDQDERGQTPPVRDPGAVEQVAALQEGTRR